MAWDDHMHECKQSRRKLTGIFGFSNFGISGIFGTSYFGFSSCEASVRLSAIGAATAILARERAQIFENCIVGIMKLMCCLSGFIEVW